MTGARRTTRDQRATRMTRAFLVALLGMSAACAKGSAGDGPAASASSAASGAPTTASAPPAAGSAAPPASGAAAAGITEWTGTYKSTEGTLTLPKDVKWKVPESAAGIGDGTLAITVEPASGRARGTVEGALGPATIDGVVVGGKLTATIARKDPTDHGFTGTLSGDLGDAGAHGTMNLAPADATAVRSATFDLSLVRGRAGEPAR